jgi:hypothetical protein
MNIQTSLDAAYEMIPQAKMALAAGNRGGNVRERGLRIGADSADGRQADNDDQSRHIQPLLARLPTSGNAASSSQNSSWDSSNGTVCPLPHGLPCIEDNLYVAGSVRCLSGPKSGDRLRRNVPSPLSND